MATWDELTALRPGAALRYEDEEFVIERTIRFEEGDCVWFEHRPSKMGEIVYHEYALADRRVTYECRSHDSVWEVSEGRAIDAAAVEIQT